MKVLFCFKTAAILEGPGQGQFTLCSGLEKKRVLRVVNLHCTLVAVTLNCAAVIFLSCHEFISTGPEMCRYGYAAPVYLLRHCVVYCAVQLGKTNFGK